MLAPVYYSLLALLCLIDCILKEVFAVKAINGDFILSDTAEGI